jgi:hypothetical protein
MTINIAAKFTQVKSTGVDNPALTKGLQSLPKTANLPIGFQPSEGKTASLAQSRFGAAVFSGAAKFQETATPKQPSQTIGATENKPQTTVSADTKGVQNSSDQVVTDNKSDAADTQPTKTKEKITPESVGNFLAKRARSILKGEMPSLPSRFLSTEDSAKSQSSEKVGTTENRPPMTNLDKTGKSTPQMSVQTETKPKATESMATETKSMPSETSSLDHASATTTVSSEMSVQAPKETASLSESGGIDTGKSVSGTASASLSSQVDTLVANLPAQLSETAAPIIGETNSKIDQATDNFLTESTGSLPESEKTEIKAKAEEFTTEVKDKLKTDIDGVIGSIAEKLTDKATGIVTKAADKLKTAANAKIDFYKNQLETATKEGVTEITQAIADEIGLGKVGDFLAGKASDGISSMTDELIGKLATKLSSEIDKQIATMTDKLNTQISDTIDGLKQDLEATVNSAIDTMVDKSGMTDTLANMGESLVNSLPPDKQSLGQAFVTTTLDIAANGKDASLTALKDEVKTSVSESLPKSTFEAVEDVGGSVVGIFQSAIGDQTKEVVTELTSFLQAPLNSVLDTVKSQMNTIGNDLVQGMLADVKAGGSELSAEMKSTVDTNLDAFLTKMEDGLETMMDSFFDQNVAESGSKPSSFEKFTETVVGDLKERLDSFKAEPKAAKIFLKKAGEAVEHFIDNPIASVGNSLGAVAKGLGMMVFNQVKETVIGKATGMIKDAIQEKVIQPAKDYYNNVCTDNQKKVVDAAIEVGTLNADEKSSALDVLQPGIDSFRSGMEEMFKDQMIDRMKSNMGGVEGHPPVEGASPPEKPEMTETMKTMQTVGTAVTTTFSVLGVLQGLSELKSGYQEIKSIMNNDKLSAFNKISGIASNSFHMLVGATRVTAGVVTISVVAGASTAGLAVLAPLAAPATMGFGLYTAGVFLKKGGEELQAARSFAVADRMINNQGPAIDSTTIKGKIHNFILTVSTGKSIDELQTMVSDIKTKHGDKAGDYVKLEQKYHNRKALAEVVRAGTVATATLAFSGLSALIPLTTPFLGPFALALPIVVGGATALVGFRIAKSPEKAAENIRTEINAKFPEPKDPMPNGHVDTTN